MSVMVSDSLKKRKRSQYNLRDLSVMKILSIVGDGTYGTVFMAEDKESGELVALKKIKMEKETQGFPVTAIREIKILKALRHPNIINLKEMLTYERSENDLEGFGNAKSQLAEGDVFMAFEYAEYDLAGLINSPDVHFTENHIKSYAKQLLQGIHFMHKNRILHRDIKGANILITLDNKLKIADLGLARSYITAEHRFTREVVTRWYRAPELLLETRRYGPEIDIWSIGCLFAEMKERTAILAGTDEANQLELIYKLCGTPQPKALADQPAGVTASVINSSTNGGQPQPDGELDVYELFSTLPAWERFPITQVYPPSISQRFAKYDKETINLISRFLTLHPKQRITAAQALDHHYFWVSEIPRPEDLPKFINIKCGHEYEARERRKAEHAQRQKERQLGHVGASSSGQVQHPTYGNHSHIQQPYYGHNRDHNDISVASRGIAGGHGTPSSLVPGARQITQKPIMGAPKPKPSVQGLTKGFKIVSNNDGTK